MTPRDITTVIDRILAEIPADEVALRASVERVRQTASYRAPEIRHLDWNALGVALAERDATLAERPAWLDRAGQIFEGEA